MFAAIIARKPENAGERAKRLSALSIPNYPVYVQDDEKRFPRLSASADLLSPTYYNRTDASAMADELRDVLRSKPGLADMQAEIEGLIAFLDGCARMTEDVVLIMHPYG